MAMKGLTLSSMIQSKVMNRKSKVTKRQKVLLTSEMHFISLASYDSALLQMGVLLMEHPSLPVSRESALLLHRLSIFCGHAPPPPPPSAGRWSQRMRDMWAWTRSAEVRFIAASGEGRIIYLTSQHVLLLHFFFLTRILLK